MILVLVLEVLQRLLGFLEDVLAPGQELVAEVLPLAVSHERLFFGRPVVFFFFGAHAPHSVHLYSSSPVRARLARRGFSGGLRLRKLGLGRNSDGTRRNCDGPASRAWARAYDRARAGDQPTALSTLASSTSTRRSISASTWSTRESPDISLISAAADLRRSTMAGSSRPDSSESFISSSRSSAVWPRLTARRRCSSAASTPCSASSASIPATVRVPPVAAGAAAGSSCGRLNVPGAERRANDDADGAAGPLGPVMRMGKASLRRRGRRHAPLGPQWLRAG